MEKSSLIFVAGTSGLVGSALVRELIAQGYTNILAPTHNHLNLCNDSHTDLWYARFKPQYTFMAAATVGGIDANSARPVDFLQNNLKVATNVIAAAAKIPGHKLMFFGSSCIYPRDCVQPIKEEYLLTGPLEPTNEWYAIAKIAGLKLCQAYRKQHRCDFISVMPTNLYGPGDNYKPGCHAIPALIDRFHKAKAKTGSVAVWGNGYALREFLYVDDLAKACVKLMQEYSDSLPINIGYGTDVTIKELAFMIAEVVGLDMNRLTWDETAPTGTPRKLVDSSRIFAMGWKPQVPLMHGLHLAYEDYLKTHTDD